MTGGKYQLKFQWKRNAVVATVLLFVCAAVYFDWSYNAGKQAEVGADGGVTEADGIETGEDGALQTDAPDAGLYYTAQNVSSLRADLKEYFDTVRLNRKQARDEASDTLSTVAGAEGVSQEAIETALKQMSDIAAWTLKESELESLICAKGFLDCVAYISADGITVTVASPEGLSNADVAKITDIVITETGFEASQLKIVEKK